MMAVAIAASDGACVGYTCLMAERAGAALSCAANAEVRLTGCYGSCAISSGLAAAVSVLTASFSLIDTSDGF